MVEPRIVFEDSGVRMVLCESMTFWFWRGMMTSERLDAGERLVKHALAKPDPIGSFTLITEVKVQGEMFLDDRIRQRHAALYRLVSERRGGNVIALEMNSLVASAARAFVSSALLISRSRFPMKIYNRREPAAAWLAERMAGSAAPITAQAILDIVRAYEAW